MSRANDIEFAKILAWLRSYGLEASTYRNGSTEIRARKPKRSRLTGEIR